jgi:hypothetical protein
MKEITIYHGFLSKIVIVITKKVHVLSIKLFYFTIKVGDLYSLMSKYEYFIFHQILLFVG